MLLLCPSIENKTQLPQICVLEKDALLTKALSEEDKSYFERIIVRQINQVWIRFKEEILPGPKIADHTFIKDNWGKKHAAYNFNVELEYPLEKPVLIMMGKQDSIVGYSDS